MHVLAQIVTPAKEVRGAVASETLRIHTAEIIKYSLNMICFCSSASQAALMQVWGASSMGIQDWQTWEMQMYL